MNGVKAEVTHWYPNRRQRNQKRDLQECLIDCGGYRFRIYLRERLDHNSSSAGYDLWISDTASHNHLSGCPLRHYRNIQ